MRVFVCVCMYKCVCLERVQVFVCARVLCMGMWVYIVCMCVCAVCGYVSTYIMCMGVWRHMCIRGVGVFGEGASVCAYSV